MKNEKEMNLEEKEITLEELEVVSGGNILDDIVEGAEKIIDDIWNNDKEVPLDPMGGI